MHGIEAEFHLLYSVSLTASYMLDIAAWVKKTEFSLCLSFSIFLKKHSLLALSSSQNQMGWAEALDINRFDWKGVKNSVVSICMCGTGKLLLGISQEKMLKHKLARWVIFIRHVGMRGWGGRKSVHRSEWVKYSCSFHCHLLNFAAYGTGVAKHHNFHLKAPQNWWILSKSYHKLWCL